MASIEKSEDKLQHIIEIEKILGQIQDVDVLLERILTETRSIVNADAGSIYVAEDSKLKIKYGQNDSLLNELAPGEKLPYTCFSFPINEKSIAGYVAHTSRPLNIEDVYKIPADKPYKFNKNTAHKATAASPTASPIATCFLAARIRLSMVDSFRVIPLLEQ